MKYSQLLLIGAAWVMSSLAAHGQGPPTIHCPTNLVFWTCSTNAVVNYGVAATPNCGSSVTITCTPPNNSSLAVGSHVVTCSAVNSCNLSNRCTFNVTVRRDTTRPVISCPANITATAASSAGRKVKFSLTAKDECDPTVDIVCAPPSGSVFPAGTTTVLCRATDDCGNFSECSFTVRVMVAGLIATPSPSGLVLSWNGCATLLAADDAIGAWSGVFAATSPYRVPMDSRHKFYRLRLCQEEPEVQLMESDNQHVRALLRFGQPELQELFDGGEDWTKVTMPGLADGSGQAGEPAVPVLRRLIGLPAGAEPFLAFAQPVRGQELFVNLYPFQPLQDEISTDVDRFLDAVPPPELFVQQPFAKNSGAYGVSNLFPRSLCTIIRLGSARGLDMALLECACGQYNPATGVLELFDSLEVQVEFKGGAGLFLPDTALNPFESGPGVYTGAVLNYAVLKNHLWRDLTARPCAGEELLILTHPSFRAAADALAQWRRDRGVPTGVFNVNDGGGSGPDTKEEIRAFIRQRYDSCVVRPSYVLLFGDVPEVPTWVMQRPPYLYPEVTIATDFPYANLASDPEALVFFPDFALGRIPIKTAAEAQTVVDKIVKYEGEPPLLSTAYRNMTVASYFQCCNAEAGEPGVENGRDFIGKAEFLRNALMDAGNTVQRIYNTSTHYHPEYTGSPTPRYFANGTELPADLAPGSGFSWSGDTPDIIDAINSGRSFVFHVDHGYTGGWGDPPFDKSNVASLTSAFPPVVFDMDCNSGNFESSSFAETMLKRDDGGGIGVFGWTRMSNTKYYRALLEGTLGAIWPGSFPAFGDGTAKRRLGDILNHSKLHMVSAHTGGDPAAPDYTNTVNHVRLYHLIGDPTLEPWTSNPFKLPKDIVLIPLPPYLEIHYGEEGAIITVQQQMAGGSVQPIGRGAVKNGIARLDYVMPLGGGPLLVSAAKANAISAPLTATLISGGAGP